MKKIPFWSFLITGSLMAGFKPGQEERSEGLHIQFRHWVGKKPLVLYDETYTNTFDEPFIVSKFKYYIAPLAYTDAAGAEHSLDHSYFLVNEEDSLSKMMVLPVTTGVQAISFLLGVDSLHNVGGVQTGSLDPANGMFWTWNSGYVFAKLEGSSDASPAPAHSFSWHVGGFKPNEDALKTITVKMNNHPAVANNTIIINVDVLSWFNSRHAIKIADSPVCHQPGKLAMDIADNYSTMFSVAP